MGIQAKIKEDQDTPLLSFLRSCLVIFLDSNIYRRFHTPCRIVSYLVAPPEFLA